MMSLTEVILVVLATALLSAIMTVLVVRWWFRRHAQPHWDEQVAALHDSIMRTVDVRVKRAMIESLVESRQGELREVPRKSSRSGAELINDGVRSLLSRRGSKDQDATKKD